MRLVRRVEGERLREAGGIDMGLPVDNAGMGANDLRLWSSEMAGEWLEKGMAWRRGRVSRVAGEWGRAGIGKWGM